MEILFKGTHPDEVKYDGTCWYCKTRVRFSRAEGEVSSSYQGSYISVKCPVCTSAICVEMK